MNTENVLRHYGKYNREEVIVVGYNKGNNALMLVRVNALTMDDQNALRTIASSEVAQKTDYLVTLLSHEPHPATKEDWFSFLCKHPSRKHVLLMGIPLKEVSEMNKDQLAFFKGYGRSVQNPGTAVAAAPAPVPAAPVQQGMDPALMQLLGSLVDGQNRLTESMERLANKLKPVKTKAARKIKKAEASA